MSTTHLRFATDILRRLGEELNPSPDQGILELVKNAYDADAVNCTIELVNTDKLGGIVHISDNGDGMDEEAIVNGWLVLGVSGKSTRQRTRLGRIPAGNKGLGRLAALRLGTTAALVTRPITDTQSQLKLRLDWLDFDQAQLVDEVPLHIERIRNKDGDTHGTDITIENLRSRINRADVKRLARSLLLLADPFADNPEGFQPALKASEFGDLARLVQKRYFDDADYHLTARVDEAGKANAVIADWQGNELYAANHDELTTSSDHGAYSCPAVEFDLWVFILNTATFSARHVAGLNEVKTWLQTFGGVHIYHNGLRVSPYGNPGNDWLEMNLARARSPEERPSTNTSIGRVSITDTQDALNQKTDRSGFIEGEVFLEIRRFAKEALDWMARRRLEEAEKRRTKERVETPKQSTQAKDSISEVIESVPPKSRDKVRDAFAKYDRARTREIKALRQEVQLYRTLSTAGITAATFAHESAGNPVKTISHSIRAIERRGREWLGENYSSTLENPVSLIVKSLDTLKVLSSVTLSLLEHEKRRYGRVDIHDTIRSVVKMFGSFLEDRRVVVIEEYAPGTPFLRGSQAAVECIVTNLLTNSLVWLDKSPVDKRKILIRTGIGDHSLSIRVLDSGPGIEEISKKDIWLPGQSTRPNGTGLGLTIVRDTVSDLGGKVDAIEHGEFGGAEIVLELPILGI